MGFWQSLLIKKQILKNSAFIWNSENSILDTIVEINSIDLNLLVAVDKQKRTLLENTKNFAKGNFTNNALLWGSRGNGKSTLIKSIFNELKNNLGNIGENKLLLITSIKVIDEYFDTKKKIDEKKLELESLSNKFRELKKLVYEYKDKKEIEINELVNNQNKVKDEILKNKEEYEKIIENATDQIENFVQKVYLENPIQ